MNRDLESDEKVLASKSDSNTTFYTVLGCTDILPEDCENPPGTVEVMKIEGVRPQTISKDLRISNLVLRNNTIYYAVSNGRNSWIKSFTEGEATSKTIYEVDEGTEEIMIQVNAECTKLFY